MRSIALTLWPLHQSSSSRTQSHRRHNIFSLLQRSHAQGNFEFKMFKRYFSTKPKPKMKTIELNTPLEQTQTITRVLFDIVKEHGPLTVADAWERVKQAGESGLKGKSHMKIVLRWMRERQKLRLICNHVGSHKQFLYTTWFTKANNVKQAKPGNDPSTPKLP